jgi:hypothetical protein
VRKELDAVALACLVETGAVTVGEPTGLLEPPLRTSGGEDFHDPGRDGPGVPQSVQDVARLERPLPSGGRRHFFAYEHPDLAGQHVHSYVVVVHMRG